MIDIDARTIGEAFLDAAGRYGANPFLVVPADPARDYHPAGRAISFAEAERLVDGYRTAFEKAGYGHGHRVAVMLENRPEMVLVKLALAQLGVSWVPVNPDYRPGEIGYLLADCGAEILISVPSREAQARGGITECGREIPLVLFDGGALSVPAAAQRPPDSGLVGPASEASLIYTSGTTGKPKGCIMSHEYELMMGAWYASRGGLIDVREGAERIYCPLPLFHVNAGILLLFNVMLTGNCQILPERFRGAQWWPEIHETGATAIHYLGVVIPVLMNRPPSELDRGHQVRWGLGAGVEPTLHGPFEDRFGFPLIEVWGMTEMCRIIANATEPRQIETRAFGKAVEGLDVRVVDGDDREVPIGEPGEMVVRHSAAAPRKGAFSGYLNQPHATEEAWRGGWFHTGDTVRRDATGMLYFVDRKKNIIRRSGENIAAAEVEACLQGHAGVAQVAVIAIDDELRDEEVMACVVVRDASADAELARSIFDYGFARLSYFKAPGWVVFVDALPVTGTQKVLKHMIFDDGVDPRGLADAHDLRGLKRR